MSDATSNSRKWLVTLSGGADSAGTALKAGVDLALAAGAFGQSVTLVFCGKGLGLLSSEPPVNDNLHRLLGSLPYYEIDRVYALASYNEAPTYRDDLTVLSMSQVEWSAAEAAADIVVNY